MPAGPQDEGAELDDKGRQEMEARLADPAAFPAQEEQLQVGGAGGRVVGQRPRGLNAAALLWATSLPAATQPSCTHCHPALLPAALQGALCFLSHKELQCLLGYLITRHSEALGPASGAAGSELLSSSAAAAAGSATPSSASSSAGDEQGDGLSSTPDLGSPGSAGALAPGGSAGLFPGDQPQLASYDPGCASVFTFSAEEPPAGAGEQPAAGEGAALLRQQLAALQAAQGGLVAELPEGRGLRWGQYQATRTHTCHWACPSAR